MRVSGIILTITHPIHDEKYFRFKEKYNATNEINKPKNEAISVVVKSNMLPIIKIEETTKIGVIIILLLIFNFIFVYLFLIHDLLSKYLPESCKLR